MDLILRKRLAILNYEDPESILHRVIPTIEGILQKPETVSHLSSAEINKNLQHYQAAFLAFMVKHMMGRFAIVSLSLQDVDDFDCVLRAVTPDLTLYKTVQLKHLPSDQINPNVDLQMLLDKIRRKYCSSPELIVVIWINRDMKLDLNTLNFDGLAVGQLWFSGDGPSGEITLTGGTIPDLRKGVCYFAWMEHGKPRFLVRRFKR